MLLREMNKLKTASTSHYEYGGRWVAAAAGGSHGKWYRTYGRSRYVDGRYDRYRTSYVALHFHFQQPMNQIYHTQTKEKSRPP